MDDVVEIAPVLKEVAGAEQTKGASDQFAAVGDEHGLLIVMKRGRVISFEAPVKKAVSIYSTKVAIRGARRTKYVLPPTRTMTNSPAHSEKLNSHFAGSDAGAAYLFYGGAW